MFSGAVKVIVPHSSPVPWTELSGKVGEYVGLGDCVDVGVSVCGGVSTVDDSGLGERLGLSVGEGVGLEDAVGESEGEGDEVEVGESEGEGEEVTVEVSEGEGKGVGITPL